MSKIAIKWLVFGALFGYFVFHPLVHVISVFHFFSGPPIPENLWSEFLKSFSTAMLPWGVAFMILNALIGLFWGKIKQADQEKSEIIAQLHKALEEVKTLSGFLPICASCKKIRDDKGIDVNNDTSQESEPGFDFLDGMSTGTARFIIDREVDPAILEKYNIKELENKGRYYLAKIVNQDGEVTETVLIDKLNRSIHFQKASRK